SFFVRLLFTPQTPTEIYTLSLHDALPISIELGFAHLLLPTGETVGVVDVPGHERFVRTMVAGAVGIDLVVLVVAADEGVMPQTRDRKSTRLNSSHLVISYAVFCLKKKKNS